MLANGSFNLSNSSSDDCAADCTCKSAAGALEDVCEEDACGDDGAESGTCGDEGREICGEVAADHFLFFFAGEEST